MQVNEVHPADSRHKPQEIGFAEPDSARGFYWAKGIDGIQPSMRGKGALLAARERGRPPPEVIWPEVEGSRSHFRPVLRRRQEARELVCRRSGSFREALRGLWQGIQQSDDSIARAG